MSFFDDSHVTDIGLQGTMGRSVGFLEMVQQGFRQQFRVDSARALDDELRTRWSDSLRALRDAGQGFNAPVDPNMYRDYARFVREGTPVTTPTIEGTGYGARVNNEARQPHPEFEEMRRANEAIRQLNNPNIKSFEQILAEVGAMQQEVEEETASMSERAGGVTGFLGQLVGAIGGSFTQRDPLNIITAPWGAGRTIATRIATDMGIAAGVTAATEYGDVAPNRALAGLPERSALFNIAAATIGAGVIRGGIEGVGAGVRRFRDGVGEDIDFDLRDTQLQQMFADNADRPSARAAASVLDDTTFIERNNPYGEGRAASERFIAELRSVQRAMNGEAMTAVGRVLPPVPFEYIQKVADFELVREQRPLIYARMEEAQARLAAASRTIENIENTVPVYRAGEGAAGGWFTTSKQYAEQIAERDKVPVWEARVSRDHPVFMDAKELDPELKLTYQTDFTPEEIFAARPAGTPLANARRVANKEYQTAYRAVEAEAARIRAEQARLESAQQGEASNILATAHRGRPFLGPLLRYDNVESLVDRINKINDTLDADTLARFTQSTKETGESAEVKATVKEDAVGDYVISSLNVQAKGKPGYSLDKTFENDGIITVVFRDKDGVAKAGVLIPLNDEQKAAYGGVITYVDPAYRRQGIATKLYDFAEEHNLPINQYSGKGDLTPSGASFVNARRKKIASEAWRTDDGRIDIGLRDPVDPDFRFMTDEGEMTVAQAMRDLQDDVDLVEAIKVCAI